MSSNANSPLANKVILVTGGTGSFGNRFVEVALREHSPKSIRVYSRGEHRQLEMEQKFDDPRLRFLIGDVRDRERLSRAMNGVDVVVHAAAMKQVPQAEYNPMEAVKTNVDGSMNVVDAAIDNNVEKVLALSTDKAVHPVNLYGATKMVAERLFIQGNAYSGARRTRMSCVRYGNVIGSQGSVVPLFRKQRETGTITITDPTMTRFWITLEQGVNFVIRCIGSMKGGEVFVPKIPSMRVTELAKALAPTAEQKIIGIRPGEKIHELLTSEDEARHTVEYGEMYVVKPLLSWWENDQWQDGKQLPRDFRYSSDNNTCWLSVDELRQLIDKE